MFISKVEHGDEYGSHAERHHRIGHTPGTAIATSARADRSGRGRTVLLPVLEILDPQDSSAARDIVDRLNEFDIAIFISANAVNKAMELITPRRGWPASLSVAAVGARTAEELQRHGQQVNIMPRQPFNSEALLSLHEMRNVASKRVIIFRGEGGRELLGDTLRERGAHIEYAEVYRRGKPAGNFSDVMDAGIDVIVVTSNESAQSMGNGRRVGPGMVTVYATGGDQQPHCGAGRRTGLHLPADGRRRSQRRGAGGRHQGVVHARTELRIKIS